MNPFISAVSIAILIALYKVAKRPNPPQSPAACGAGFFIATAGVASTLYLLAIVPSSLFYLAASILVLPFLSTVAGYVSARTAEDTSSMNAKIVAGVAYIPYSIICFLSLSNLPGWIIIYALICFVPCVIIGLKVYEKRNPAISNA